MGRADGRNLFGLRKLVERFIKRAKNRNGICAVFIVGSRARIDCPADEWSDLDIVAVATDPECYLASSKWPENIGIPWLTFVEPTATGGERGRRVLFEGRPDVYFAIVA